MALKVALLFTFVRLLDIDSVVVSSLIVVIGM
jgi:hypothetical protein